MSCASLLQRLFSTTLPLLFCTAVACAQSTARPDAFPTRQYSAAQERYMSRLEQLLSAGDGQTLANELLAQRDPSLASAGLDWAGAKLRAGAGLPVQLLYIQDLWRFGASDSNFKETASLITLYTLSAIFADGVKCEDKSATDAVLHRVTSSASFHETLSYFKQLSANKQTTYRATALRMEAAIAPMRQDDEYLCRWGAEAFADYEKKHGDQGLTNAPGGTKVIPIDPTYHPKFLPPDQWQPMQAATRQRLPELLNGAVALVISQR